MEAALKESFLREQLFGLSFQGMAQRGHLYRAEADAARKEAWRSRVFERLRAIDTAAVASMADAHYIAWLCGLHDEVGGWQETAAVMKNGRWRVGSAQKLINLWLKYLWCHGTQALPPPHFPVDGVILNHIPSMRHIRWTELDDWNGYRGIIAEARALAGAEPLALWELRRWQSPSRSLKA